MANTIEITLKANNQTKKALDEVEDDLKDVKTSAKDAGDGTKSFGDKWTTAMLGINQTIQVLQAAYGAIKQIYEIASEGADLLYMEDRFDNLTTAIGTTADALMDDLREATKGLKSDAELMGGATDFMALGLAKSHDEVVRLSTVAGALGMNMNQLVLTLTNQTTMRFDALGVSVTGFDEKVEALKETGLSAEEAFNEAFLQQAEEQIEKVGHAADSATGSFDKFEAGIKNLGDTIKKDLTNAALPAVELLANELTVINANRAIEDMEQQLLDLGYSAEYISGLWKGKTFFLFDEEGAAEAALEYIAILRGELDEAGGAAEYARRMTDPYSNSMESAGYAALYLAESQEKAALTAQAVIAFEKELSDYYTEMASQAEMLTGMYNKYSESLEGVAGDISDVARELGLLYAEKPSEEQQEGILALEGTYDGLITKVKEIAAAHREASNAMIFDLMTQKLAADGLTPEEFAVLMNIGEDLGVLEEGSANAMRKLDIMLDGVLEDGDVTEEELGEISGHIDTFTSTVPGAQAVMDSVLEKVKADGEVTRDELDEIHTILGDLYTNADARKAALNEILSGFVEDSETGKLNVDEISAALMNIDGKTFETELIVTVTEVGGTVPEDGFATGGIIRRAPGGLTAAAGGYWVGEAGPEPFFPAENGRILSNTEARAAMREGGGRGANIVNVTINTPVNLADRAFVQREITPYIMAALRKERVSDYL